MAVILTRALTSLCSDQISRQWSGERYLRLSQVVGYKNLRGVTETSDEQVTIQKDTISRAWGNI